MYCHLPSTNYVGVATAHFIGVDKLMLVVRLSPPGMRPGPTRREVVGARTFKDASPDDRFKITRGNVARL